MEGGREKEKGRESSYFMFSPVRFQHPCPVRSKPEHVNTFPALQVDSMGKVTGSSHLPNRSISRKLGPKKSSRNVKGTAQCMPDLLHYSIDDELNL